MKVTTVFSLGLIFLVQQSSQKHIGSRIIGGQEARAAQFPFAAAIYVQKPGATTFCGGALISNLWVITAAHCIFNATSTTVQLGSTLLNGPDPNRLIIATDNVVVHPLFNPVTFENDVGLLMFRMSVQFNDYVRSTTFFPIADLPGSARVTTFGWGQTSDSVPGVNNELQYVQLTTITNEECNLFFNGQISDSLVCVSGNYNEGICNGDSGTPLIQNIGNGHTLIVGIASFLSTSGCETTDPSGYTRVFQYKDWITAVTGVN